jgi:hypothetical protein
MLDNKMNTENKGNEFFIKPKHILFLVVFFGIYVILLDSLNNKTYQKIVI